jgi:L-alanine-DL-glutamate epimerase-like enolase superfamily enzyme
MIVAQCKIAELHGLFSLTAWAGPCKKPVYQLLGGSDAISLSAYASLTRYSNPELVRKDVERALSSGFRHLKLHEIDVNCGRAAREAAADDV